MKFFFSPEKTEHIHAYKKPEIVHYLYPMNFKKYIIGLLVTLFFSVPSFAEKSDFFGKGEVVMQGAGNPFKIPSAKGLIGKNFEEFLVKNLPEGEAGFMKGGREFDAVYGTPKKWVEAKSGGYWTNQTSSEPGLAKFKSDMGDRLRIAKENGVDYELFSNSSIPDNIKTWLDGKGIKYYEILE